MNKCQLFIEKAGNEVGSGWGTIFLTDPAKPSINQVFVSEANNYSATFMQKLDYIFQEHCKGTGLWEALLESMTVDEVEYEMTKRCPGTCNRSGYHNIA
jgi:hypothetical protein